MASEKNLNIFPSIASPQNPQFSNKNMTEYMNLGIISLEFHLGKCSFLGMIKEFIQNSPQIPKENQQRGPPCRRGNLPDGKR